MVPLYISYMLLLATLHDQFSVAHAHYLSSTRVNDLSITRSQLEKVAYNICCHMISYEGYYNQHDTSTLMPF